MIAKEEFSSLSARIEWGYVILIQVLGQGKKGVNIEGIPHPVSSSLKVFIKQIFKNETVQISKLQKVAVQQPYYKNKGELPIPV